LSLQFRRGRRDVGDQAVGAGFAVDPFRFQHVLKPMKLRRQGGPAAGDLPPDLTGESKENQQQ
jgi:hypothetical protein